MTDPDDKRRAEHADRRPPAIVGIWLLVCGAFVLAMVILGGATRLTDSGLSIVEWQPVSGVLPPLSAAAWEREFAAYRQFPEFQAINPDMTLEEFKSIYWFEYAHRLLGRVVGFVFLLPLLIFALRRMLTARITLQLVGIFVLGALQGVLGWYMVQSGLVDRPDVSQYRLAAHLGLAVLIYVFLLRTALGILMPERIVVVGDRGRNLASTTNLAVVAIFTTMMFGALVAGLDAGLVYNTFPLMDGRWVPEDLLETQPWFINFGENPATVQFVHRCLALVTTIMIVVVWLRAIRSRAIDIDPEEGGSLDHRLAHVLLMALVVQLGLGIATLIYLVPLHLALAHQAGAMVVLTLCVWLAHVQVQRKEVVL